MDERYNAFTMSAPNENAAPVEAGLVRAHGVAAFVMLFISLGFGYHAAKGLSSPGSLDAYSSWLTWGKMRYDHTQGILFGWLANAFFAFLYHAVPILTARPVTNARLGQWLFGLWNFAVVIPGWILVVIVGREFAVTGLRSIAATEGIVLAADASGKAKMLLQTIGVHFLIVHYVYFGVSFHDIGMILLVMSAAVGVWSAVGYHIEVFHRMRDAGRPGTN